MASKPGNGLYFDEGWGQTEPPIFPRQTEPPIFPRQTEPPPCSKRLRYAVRASVMQ